MSDDLLRDAMKALREVGADADGARELTRARVMASLHRDRRRRVTVVAWLLPVAAVLVTFSAWGAATGRIQSVWLAVIEVVGATGVSDRSDLPASAIMPTQPKAPQPASVATVPDQKEPAEKPPEAVVDEAVQRPAPPSQPTTAVNKTSQKPKARQPHSRTAGDGSGSTDEPSREHTLYREAHHAHFALRDSGTALRAWNAYLREAPRGRFAAEARYNRAICLVRLGRHAEAHAALQPFARGAYGRYRQDDAKKLIEAMKGKAP